MDRHAGPVRHRCHTHGRRRRPLTTELPDPDGRNLLQASALLLFAAVLPWLWHLYASATDPAAFASGSLPTWPILAYFFLTEAGLALYGAALLTMGVAPWLGWTVIGSVALLFAITLIARDMVPPCTTSSPC